MSKINKKNRKNYYYKIYTKYKNNGYLSLFEKYRKFRYFEEEFGVDLGAVYLTKYCQEIVSVSNFIVVKPQSSFEKYWERIYKEHCNERQRYKTCRKFIEKMFDKYDNKYFFTFTLDNKHLKKYSDDVELFKSYVKDFFKNKFKNWNSYVFNIDYGSYNGRLHIHCLLSSDLEELDFKALHNMYKLGNLDILKTYNNDVSKLSKYINKFTFHAFKDTTLCKCCYSRKKRG